MGRPKKPFPPAPAHHRDQMRVWWNGTWHHLGLAADPAGWKARYAQLVALWSVDPTAAPLRKSEYLVADLLGDYLESADSPPGGDQRARVVTVAGLLGETFAATPAGEFGPTEFAAWQAWLCGLKREGATRTRFNGTTIRDFRGVVKAVWKWGARAKRVTAEAYQLLRTVPPPRFDQARPPRAVKPADPAAVEAIIPHLPPLPRAVVLLLRGSAARPTEILTLRPADLDRSGDVWVYRPEKHKGTWRGKTREVYLGAVEQAVLTPWLEGVSPDQFVFTPARGEAARGRQPGTRNLAGRYDRRALLRAVQRACDKAGVPRLTSYQLRHLRGTEVRKTHGLESARAVLGQSQLSMADRYSQFADADLASQVARDGRQ